MRFFNGNGFLKNAKTIVYFKNETHQFIMPDLPFYPARSFELNFAAPFSICLKSQSGETKNIKYSLILKLLRLQKLPGFWIPKVSFQPL